jgi:hypothetical protein
VSSIIVFELELVPEFFHMDPIKKFRSYLQSWNFISIDVITFNVMGRGDSKGEK